MLKFVLLCADGNSVLIGDRISVLVDVWVGLKAKIRCLARNEALHAPRRCRFLHASSRP